MVEFFVEVSIFLYFFGWLYNFFLLGVCEDFVIGLCFFFVGMYIEDELLKKRIFEIKKGW